MPHGEKAKEGENAACPRNHLQSADAITKVPLGHKKAAACSK